MQTANGESETWVSGRGISGTYCSRGPHNGAGKSGGAKGSKKSLELLQNLTATLIIES